MRTTSVLAASLALSLLAAAGCTDYMKQALPAPQSDEQALAFAVDRFAVDLYAATDRDDEDNAVISPYSVSSALGMAYPGARGTTAAQMADVLHLTLDQERSPRIYGDLTGGLVARNQLDPATLSPDEDLELILRIEDSAWLQQSLPWEDDYLAALADGFDAELFEVDYDQATDVTDEINGWVDDCTEGMIPSLIPDGTLDAAVRLVLVNAIYFWGSWADPFEPEDTTEHTFHPLAGGTVEVPMMEGERGRFLRGTNFKAIELPYARGTVSMFVVLPDSGQFTTVERQLSAGGLYHIAHAMESHPTDVWLPTFRIDQHYLLGDTLREMGMSDAFDPGRADFSGMNGGAEALFISEVIHQAVIDVSEEGTEAAAATAVVMKGVSEELPQQPKQFHATRPFLFALYDTESDVVLFVGRVVDPS